jgi:hypothetical protein
LTEHTTTECLLFPDILDRPVVARFDQRQSSSDGGAILLKAADRRLGLTAALTTCLEDERQPGKVRHELHELLTQRIITIACGYEDANDAAHLASDPLHKLLVARDPIDGEDLASQSTLSHFENTPDRKQLFRMTEALADSVIARHRKRLRLTRTASAQAQVSTLRQRFLKRGAQVVASIRRIVLHLPKSYPYLESFRRLAER